MAATDARERVLDAFVALLIEQGERAATLDSVAKSAGVSKGGLLYHFASKEALIAGLLERLKELGDADVVKVRDAPEGAVRYFLRTSVSVGSPLDQAILATTRLAQGSHPQAREALASLQAGWHEVILETVADPTLARAIMLLSDGIYYNSSLLNGTFGTADGTHNAELNDLLNLVEWIVQKRS